VAACGRKRERESGARRRERARESGSEFVEPDREEEGPVEATP
jgi:hypothetical protein